MTQTESGKLTHQGTEPAWESVQASPEFGELRRRLRVFVFPMTAFFISWYLLYVLLAAYASDFMAIKVVGNINVGLIFGLRPVRVDLRHHRPVRPLRQPHSTRSRGRSATTSKVRTK